MFDSLSSPPPLPAYCVTSNRAVSQRATRQKHCWFTGCMCLTVKREMHGKQVFKISLRYMHALYTGKQLSCSYIICILYIISIYRVCPIDYITCDMSISMLTFVHDSTITISTEEAWCFSNKILNIATQSKSIWIVIPEHVSTLYENDSCINMSFF